MDPRLKALADKYAERLVMDALFSFRVKTIFKAMRTISPAMSADDLRVRAYMLACVLEESHLPASQQGMF